MSDWLADAAPTKNTGQPAPPITFTRVGTLAAESWQDKRGAGQHYPEVWRCERCKALVLKTDLEEHVAHHAQHGLERWPDPDSGNLVREDTEDDR